MIRRFYTSRDIEALSADGSVLAVGADDVVTPSAMEAAARRGVQVERGDGRDATLPLAVEPSAAVLDSESGTRSGEVILTAFGRNRPWVLAEISNAIAQQCGNVLDISQRIVRDYFSLVLIVDIAEIGTDFATFKQDLEALSRESDYRVSVQHENVFRAMHRV